MTALFRKLLGCLLIFGTIAIAATDPALSDLGAAINSYNARDYSGVITRLRGKNIPRLADYIAYYLGSAEQQTGDFDSAIALLNSYRAHPVESSPLAGKITILHGRVLVDKHDPALAIEAVKILQANYSSLPQPDGDFALALAAHAAGDDHEAAVNYQKVYFGAPASDLAADAGNALDRLRAAMGQDYPAPSIASQLDRCGRLLDARQYRRARAEYFALAQTATGEERDIARVGVGKADVLSGQQTVALHYLEEFRAAGDAEAERLYYVTEAARKTVDDSAMNAALSELEKNFPNSRWRLRALIAAGNRYISGNDRAHYTPLYQTACAQFPADPATAPIHWRLVWDAYTASEPARIHLLREQIERYPSDGHVSTALYFLGRIAEAESRPAEAEAYYSALSARFPNYFYTTLAKERKQPSARPAPDRATVAWLDTIAWPKHRDLSDSEPNGATARRMERSRLLVEAGQPDLADAEVRYGARTGNEQPHLLAIDVAANEEPFKALRLVKSLAADYLAIPLNQASSKLWQVLFPMPWKSDIERDADLHNLDPYYVAGLIRQESEFNPQAKSRAGAYGLMQLMPSTGRMLARQQGLTVTRPTQLFSAPLNLQLGTKYLKAQLDTWGGDWYRTLAAYNAGPSRVRGWTADAAFREPLEFVESIPFDETREYVQAVIRNASIYRDLYTGVLAKVAPATPAAKPQPAGVKKPLPAPVRGPR